MDFDVIVISLMFMCALVLKGFVPIIYNTDSKILKDLRSLKVNGFRIKGTIVAVNKYNGNDYGQNKDCFDFTVKYKINDKVYNSSPVFCMKKVNKREAINKYRVDSVVDLIVSDEYEGCFIFEEKINATLMGYYVRVLLCIIAIAFIIMSYVYLFSN